MKIGARMSKEAAWFDDQTEPVFGAYHGGPHNIQMVHGGMNDNGSFGWRRPVVYDEHDDRL
jgi:hypothetical protein